jgi:hypothetical protein
VAHPHRPSAMRATKRKFPAMASIVEVAEEQKSFGSFLQKRTSSLKI